jgi:site-specific DNA-methyltransferase (adenine-specific)
MKVIKKEIGEILLDPSNVRTHDKANLDAITASLKRFGQQKPIVLDSNGIVRAGNGTLVAAKNLGWKDINVVVSDLAASELTAYAIADNRTAELAEWDEAGLMEQLKSLDEELREIAFADYEFPAEIESSTEKDDEVPDTTQNEFGVVEGDVWQLGEHKLLCGDATQIASYEKLLGQAKADMVFTDPPYNLDYEGGTGLKIQNDNMDNDSFRKFLYDTFLNLFTYTKDGGPIYISHADSEGYNFRGALIDSGWLLKQCIIWVKDRLVMGRQDYHWKHEPILYGWKPGAAHVWNTDRKQTTCWEFDKPNSNKEHPTMKPVALVQYAITNSSKARSSVLDPFGGSGTTLIACQKADRKCFTMELEPHYCSVIIKRWQELTGKEAIRAGENG